MMSFTFLAMILLIFVSMTSVGFVNFIEASFSWMIWSHQHLSLT